MTGRRRHTCSQRRLTGSFTLLLLTTLTAVLASLTPPAAVAAVTPDGLPICHPRIRLAFQLELDDYRRRLERVRNSSTSSIAHDNPIEMMLRWIDAQVLNYKGNRKRAELEEIVRRDYGCRSLLR
ncbi:MAG: hypothetical protein VKI83_06480 [Synechococcaceae cyanobacterium]|nr:hypothetical protein [Synechococcaceae cyanobacterium]